MREIETPRPAVTVASIIERDGRYLLVEEETRHGPRLNQPAGTRVGRDAAGARSTKRSGNRLGRHAVRPRRRVSLGSVGQWRDVVRLHSAATRCATTARPLDVGILRAVWLTAEEIAARRDLHRSPLVMRCIDDYCADRRWPLRLRHGDALTCRGASA
jgi:hypothetical protein